MLVDKIYRLNYIYNKIYRYNYIYPGPNGLRTCVLHECTDFLFKIIQFATDTICHETTLDNDHTL